MNKQWFAEYCRRQDQINGWCRQRYGPRLRPLDRIQLLTPYDYQTYLQQSPCDGCGAEPCCDVPCPAYLQWYDARMRRLRFQLGGASWSK